MKKSKGFTLIELMIVVLIIGILAAIAIPKYKDITIKAKASTIIADTRVILTAAQLYLADNGQYPPDDWWGVTPEGLEPYLPDGFSFARHQEWDIVYSFDNLHYPREYRSYARRVGMWVSISVWTRDQDLLNALMEVAPGYMTPKQPISGRKRVSAILEPYIN